jgi:chromosome segregation ATPase
MFWIIIVSFAVLMGLAIMIYLLPADASSKSKKKEKPKEKRPELIPDAATAKQKDWEAIAHRWEKQNNALLGDIEKLKMEQKKYTQDVEQQKVQNKDLVDKLTLEKSWREKEQVTLDKSKTHEKSLQDQIIRTEGDLEKEHSMRMRLERELQELKIKFDEVNEEKRQSVVKATSLETTLTQANKDLKDLKRENVELGRRREDIQWVAKSEYDELKKKLTDVEKELARLKPNA